MDLLQDFEKAELIFLENKKLKIPFLTVNQIIHQLDPKTLPIPRPLRALDNFISPDQNEELSLLVIMFRLWGFYYKSIQNAVKEAINNGTGIDTRCRLGNILPIRHQQSNPFIKFMPSFGVRQTPHQINDSLTWQKFEEGYHSDLEHGPDDLEVGIAFQNLPGAQFADGIIMTDPPIFIQDKLEVQSRRKEATNYSPNILDKDLVEVEHKKVTDAYDGNHIFVFVTDAHARSDEKYKDNVVVITSETRSDFYGNILAQRKLYSIERC